LGATGQDGGKGADGLVIIVFESWFILGKLNVKISVKNKWI
jgi:hypothetical protein